MNAFTKLFSKQRAAAADVYAGIADLRARIAVLEDERARVEELPVPLDEAVAALDRWLDDLEGRYSVSVGSFTTGRPGSGPALTMGDHSILPGLLLAAARDAIRNALADHLADYYEGREAASAAEKAKRLASIHDELDALCRVEERLIREAEASNLPILRRETAAPEIVIATDDELAD